jgi:dienelactone hydrolase
LSDKPGVAVLLKSFIHRRERRYHERDNNRLVRPFEWGLPFVSDQANGDEPREFFRRFIGNVMERSDDFYALPEISDYVLSGDQLTWTSAVSTSSLENNRAHARYFPASPKPAHPRRAIVVLPQWNAQPNSHVEACRIFNLLGISALRLTLPYHLERRPPELERADYLVSPNVGRTIQSMRQAVLDTRAAVRWLKSYAGYDRIGILGTSIGSCTAFLAFAHEPLLAAGAFNHVSTYVADVVWKGLSTQHVRAGLGDHVTLEELRNYWLPISPFPFLSRVARNPRPMRFIVARYDLTFPVELSHDAISEARRHNLPLDVVWLRCGHYTTGELPWKAIDAWKIATFFRKQL